MKNGDGEMFDVTRHSSQNGDVPCERTVTYTVFDNTKQSYFEVMDANNKPTIYLTKKQYHALIGSVFKQTNFKGIP